MHTLKISLKDMESKTGIKASTISAFEKGKSNNMKNLIAYAQLCLGDDVLMDKFERGVINAIWHNCIADNMEKEKNEVMNKTVLRTDYEMKMKKLKEIERQLELALKETYQSKEDE